MAKKKTKAGQLFKKLYDDIKNVGQGIGRGIHKVGQKVVEIETFVVLAPFKSAMKAALKSRKIKHTNKLSDIAPKFVKHVVKGRNFENYQGDLKHYENYEALENLETLEQYELYWANGEISNFDPVTTGAAAEGGKISLQVVSSIVKAVVDFFKNILKKKKEGKELTEEEAKLAKIAEQGAAVSDQVIQDEIAANTGTWVMDNKTMLILAAVIVAYFLFRRK